MSRKVPPTDVSVKLVTMVIDVNVSMKLCHDAHFFFWVFLSQGRRKKLKTVNIIK